jgi:hypothetical protein
MDSYKKQANEYDEKQRNYENARPIYASREMTNPESKGK